MARVLIFGGTGFCGSHLAEACLAAGDEVFVTGRARGERLAEEAALRFLPVEVTRFDEVARAIEEAQPERIYHLAGLASVARSLRSEEEVYRVNVLGTCHVLRAVRERCREARVLVVGSAEEYGPVAREELPLAEEAPLRPLSPYGVSRVASTLMSLREARAEGLAIIATRTFNLVGPRQSRTFICSDFAAQIARAKVTSGARAITIETGNLEVRRDFSSVHDGVEAYRRLIEQGEPGRVYNVCSGKATKARAILETLGRLAGLEVEARTAQERLRKSEIMEVRGDPTLLVETTGLCPGHLEEALARLLEDWIARYRAGR